MTSVREFIADYWPIAATVLQVLLVWVAWSLRQVARTEISAVDNKFTEKFDGHDKRIQDNEARLDVVEEDIKDLPTKADLERVRGEVASVGVKVNASNEGIRRIEGFFLQKGVDAR